MGPTADPFDENPNKANEEGNGEKGCLIEETEAHVLV
jgi:hypothetical protein